MRNKRGIAAGIAGLAVLAGLGIGATVAQAGGNAGDGQDDPALNSSVTAPAGPDHEGDSDAAEAAESRDLEALATVTPAEAEAAALAAVPGTAATPELENENGSVVYGVEVTKDDGTVVDVKVDAGNGDVLAQETDGPDGADGNEADEGPEGAEGSAGSDAANP